MDQVGAAVLLWPDQFEAGWKRFKEKYDRDARNFLDDNWMRVAPGTDAAIWRPWSRETGEL